MFKSLRGMEVSVDATTWRTQWSHHASLYMRWLVVLTLAGYALVQLNRRCMRVLVSESRWLYCERVVWTDNGGARGGLVLFDAWQRCGGGSHAPRRRAWRDSGLPLAMPSRLAFYARRAGTVF
jgi:hypothetical protein